MKYKKLPEVFEWVAERKGTKQRLRHTRGKNTEEK